MRGATSITLDLDSDVVLGWEHPQNLSKVISLAMGILRGDDIPPVYVIEDCVASVADRRVFRLPTGWEYPLTHTIDKRNFGGHHRTLAYAALSFPLPSLSFKAPWIGSILDLQYKRRAISEYALEADETFEAVVSGSEYELPPKYRALPQWMVGGVQRLVDLSPDGSVPIQALRAYFRSPSTRKLIRRELGR